MKKVLSILLVIALMFALSACSMLGGEGAEGDGEQGSMWTTMLPLLLVVVVFYLIMFLPQRKRDKKAKEMLNSMEVGDGATTIGGIVGRIVSIKDDTVLLETGSDRTKIRFQKGAISEVEKLTLED